MKKALFLLALMLIQNTFAYSGWDRTTSNPINNTNIHDASWNRGTDPIGMPPRNNSNGWQYGSEGMPQNNVNNFQQNNNVNNHNNSNGYIRTLPAYGNY